MINKNLNSDASVKIKTSPNGSLKANFNNVIAIPTSDSYVKNFTDSDWVKDLIYYKLTVPFNEHKLKQPHITTFLVNENDALQNAVLFYKVLTNDDVVIYADMKINGILKIEEI